MCKMAFEQTYHSWFLMFYSHTRKEELHIPKEQAC